MKLSAFGLSDIGVSRPNNEDVWVAMPEIGFFAIADGMGGHQAGETAARETIEHLSHSIKTMTATDPLNQMLELKGSIEKANAWVYQQSKEEESLSGMGTTLCCLIWTKDAVIYAHVGDSRLYRMRKGKLELLTQDHSLFAKWIKAGLKSHTPYPYKNVITRAIGTAPRAHPEMAISRPAEGDLYFLCTDGLSDVLAQDDIEKTINSSLSLERAARRNPGPLGPGQASYQSVCGKELAARYRSGESPSFEEGVLQSIAKNLIQKAKIKGSSDNITILIVKNDGNDLPRQQRDDPARPESLRDDALGTQRAPS